MTRQHFKSVLPVDPELIRVLEQLRDETLTGATMPPQHLGHHYGPVHPEIVEYTLPK